jgi:hypothetical protein
VDDSFLDLASVKGLLFLEEGGVGLDCSMGWSVFTMDREWLSVDKGIPLEKEKRIEFSILARVRAIAGSNDETHGIPPTFKG